MSAKFSVSAVHVLICGPVHLLYLGTYFRESKLILVVATSHPCL